MLTESQTEALCPSRRYAIPPTFRLHLNSARQAALCSRIPKGYYLATVAAGRQTAADEIPNGSALPGRRYANSQRRRRDIVVEHPPTKNHKLRRSDIIGEYAAPAGALKNPLRELQRFRTCGAGAWVPYRFSSASSRKAIGEDSFTSAAEPITA